MAIAATTDARAKIVFENVQNALGAQDIQERSLEFEFTAHAIHTFMMAFPEMA
jgi:hypothetical protein